MTNEHTRHTRWISIIPLIVICVCVNFCAKCFVKVVFSSFHLLARLLYQVSHSWKHQTGTDTADWEQLVSAFVFLNPSTQMCVVLDFRLYKREGGKPPVGGLQCSS